LFGHRAAQDIEEFTINRHADFLSIAISQKNSRPGVDTVST